ncbi:hypothetical protein M408DRAFT_295359 [Serendipita vermifera MAFF 305830]|uniref:C2H2-type domain-containing protein n=1 Tax=Serendipita vermifera MAFF 305830 TaxID=933852 RepID=A0A0C2XMN9_SERVB|nr:hypothetical protein M408DRAFT_295359 [Serendipita vermifera MAFF 305830]
MDGSLQPRRDANSIIPANDTHTTDTTYAHNGPTNAMNPYGTSYPFQNTIPPLGLNQIIAAYSSSQQSMQMTNTSPAFTNSPTIFSPATPIYMGQSPSLSTPIKSPYSPNSPAFGENPSLFSSLGAGRLDSGWNPMSSPHSHGGDLHYSTSSTHGLHPEAHNPDSSHSMSNPINAFNTTPPVPGTRPWLQSRLTNLSPNQRSEVESRFEAWLHDPDRQILVVNILCDWFEQEKQPRKEDLLKFYQAKLGVTEDGSRSRGGKGGQGARGGAIGYACEWPGCGKELSGRTDRVHEDALNHLNIKIFACDANDCNASFLRKNELNRHVKSCKFQHPNTNALFLTMPSTPMASTSRQTTSRSASNRPARRNTRSFRGVSADISPSTSGRDSPLVPRMTDSFQPFLPQGHFQPMNQHTPQMSLFGNMADAQMIFHGHNTQQQQPPASAPPTLLQGQAQAQAHARHHHSRNNSSSQQQQESLVAGNSSGINAGDLNPMAAYADQVCPPHGYHG